jgi:AbrB family looped-hinge helix DNA binding protein
MNLLNNGQNIQINRKDNKYNMSKIITYKVEDIFQDIEGDPDNVNMNIPPEISERMGWTEGDILKITVEDGQISISKKEPDVKE